MTEAAHARIPISGGTMSLQADPRYSLYDFYGNPVAAQDGKIVIPLDTHGYFLRGDGKPGSFAALLNALRAARIDGLEPVQIAAHDLTTPLQAGAALQLEITNVLNRPVHGQLSASLGVVALTGDSGSQTLTIPPQTTQTVELKVSAGTAEPNNTYPLHVVFDAGADGRVVHDEDMHCNVVAHRTIKVDGDLSDWQGVLPQPVAAGGNAPSLTEQAWYPNKKFEESLKSGFATGYLAYDADNFYFAARVADDTPEPGTLRFATRDDDAFFFPEVVYARPENDPNGPWQTLHWPAGVRRYTYRKDPILPAGNGNTSFDNVQIAFNVIPENDVEDKGVYPYPPGTMPHYAPYRATDYEFALNQVAPQYGGGTEIWRLEAPGMPHKHFYPREPKSPLDGAVTDGKLSVRRDGNTRIVECAIPWGEIPWVKKRLDAGQTVKFSFRVNDGNGPSYEMAHDRSASNQGGSSFLCDWTGGHWANEIRFGFAK
jgi:hypothetical protein